MKNLNISDINGKNIDFNSPVNHIDRALSPFKEIITHEDYEDLSIVVDEEELSFKETLQLQVNVDKVGSFNFLFKSKDFNKDKIVPAVLELKKVEISSVEEAKDKVKSLFNAVKDGDPLFVIYDPKGDFILDDNALTFLGVDITVLALEKLEVIVDPKQGSAIEGKKYDPNKKHGFFDVVWAGIKAFFRPIKQDKFNFVFAFLASFIIGFTCGTGIYNAFGGKMIAVFFFVCCGAGAFLNAFVYGDLFKEAGIKSMKYATTVVTSLVGLGVATIGSTIFFKMQTYTPEGFPSMAKIYLVFILISLAIYIASMFISYPIRWCLKLIKKNNK